MWCKITENYRIYAMHGAYFCAGRRARRKLLYTNHLRTALRKAMFYSAKDGLLPCVLPSFTRRKATFQPLMKNNTAGILLSTIRRVFKTKRATERTPKHDDRDIKSLTK